MPPVASFHLQRVGTVGAVVAMAEMVGQGRLARRVPGLRFARRLGTGRGRGMGLQADLRRWALFAMWDDEAALDAFLTTDPLARRWRERSEETYTLRLVPLAGHGTWGGADPLAGVDDVAAARLSTEPGPVAVLTRATIPPRHWRAFQRAVPPVEARMHAAPGLLEAVGVGERPVGLLATFSLWRSAADLDGFAYDEGPHRDVIASTRAGGWFSEALFARFRPYGSTGTWAGRDPLTGTLARPSAAGNGS